jgi:MoaE-MoaD fusion protein
MRVRVLVFGMLKDLLPRASDTVDLDEGSTVAQIVSHLLSHSPQAQNYAGSLAIAVNREYASPARVLRDGDEVALLPPVSGGAETAESPGSPIRLQREPIDPAHFLQQLKSGSDGAVAIFDGIVRDNTRGRRTLYLDYEAYEEMALDQMSRLADEATQHFGVRKVALVHRLGRLQIGETSVWIAVASAHRAQAFDACRWIIDMLKKTVPIWKKEYFEDGAVWADGEPFPAEISLQKSK